MVAAMVPLVRCISFHGKGRNSKTCGRPRSPAYVSTNNSQPQSVLMAR
eukprot:CAMPEP_0179296830 /NCGR_PEP_ID=MMETSP0797-20121207/45144_1 /TAXON_ID=47934 /ORGANISM="Dinophysis acuminata, Strain DAEP01" /LENGTH=47 /DNA_ID= /DNA_START= /DNA_END= /DNA_ORIENTATION=